MEDFKTTIAEMLSKTSSDCLASNEDILLPRYDGYALTNITSTICRLFNIPGFGEQPLADSLLSKLTGSYKNIVLLLVDALGFQLLEKLMASGYASFWQNREAESVYFPLTSISPSTTASALTTIWTGVSPITHGIIGYEMWLKELGMVINNILHAPMSFFGEVGTLKHAGFDPMQFLNRPTLGQHLIQHGISASAFMHYAIGSSGLSSMHLDKIALHGYVNESDMWVSIRNLLNNNPKGRHFVYAYWSMVDTLTHRFGLNDERIAVAFSDFSRMIEEVFVGKLANNRKEDTLLILTADHGSVYTPRYDDFDLRNHPDLMNMLRIQPTCEHRLAFLYTKPGMDPDVRAYFAQKWPGKFTIITGNEAIESGLFGIGPKISAASDRVGDLVAIALGDAYLWWSPKPNVMLGRHGGLHPSEMLIPFYALPL